VGLDEVAAACVAYLDIWPEPRPLPGGRGTSAAYPVTLPKDRPVRGSVAPDRRHPLLARGLQTKQVARALGISLKTADRHFQNAYRKIGVSTRAAATLFTMEHGLVAWGELPIARPAGRSSVLHTASGEGLLTSRDRGPIEVGPVDRDPGVTAGDRAWRRLWTRRASVERECGRLNHQWSPPPLRIRGLERVRLHADLTILAEARPRPYKNASLTARGVSPSSSETLAPQESRAPPSLSPRRVARASAVFALWGPGLMAAGPVPQAYSSPGEKTKEVLRQEGPVAGAA
jgi:hypothetical protein